MAETPRTPRTIRLVRPPAGDGVGVFCIAVSRQTQFYVLLEIPCEIGGRGFVVHRLGMGDVYHVRAGAGAADSCECLGFLRWGRCKHVLGLGALIRRGQL